MFDYPTVNKHCEFCGSTREHCACVCTGDPEIDEEEARPIEPHHHEVVCTLAIFRLWELQTEFDDPCGDEPPDCDVCPRCHLYWSDCDCNAR